jgi:thiol-disulfide isomerase/thioredoxin
VNEPKSRIPRLIGAVLIVAAAFGVGLLVYKSGVLIQPSSSKNVSVLTPIEKRPEPDQSTATVPETATLKKAIPDTLPDIILADRTGKPTKLASFGGRPLMVNFWATWCAPCRREIPLLNRIRAERKSQNAEIVGIAVDFKDDVLEFVKKVPLDYPLLIGEEDGLAAAEAFGMGMAFPFSVFVDSQNRILTIKIGELHEDEANFAFDRIRDIDNGILTREAAQASVAGAFREMAAARARTEAAASQGVN